MISMNLLVATTMKVSLIVGLALLAVALLRKQSAAVRHWVLSVAMVCAAVVPLFVLVVPSWDVRSGTSSSPPQVAPPREHPLTLSAPSSAVAAARQPVEAGAAQPQRWKFLRAVATGRLLGQIWIVGAGMSLGLLLIGLARLAWLASGARKIVRGRWTELAQEIGGEYGLRRPSLLLQSNHPTLLVTWGLVQPKVILPAAAREWPEDRIRVVIAHELAHIRRGDWLVQIVAEILRSVYWFNPLVWMICRRLRLESERACDDAVLNGGTERLDYATHLLEVARTLNTQRRLQLPAQAMARPSSLERRMRAMLNTGLNRNPVTRTARIATAIALVGITVPIAGFGASAQTEFATVSGTVQDPSGAVLPGVEVTLTLAEDRTPATIAVDTDAGGHFEFVVGLPPGQYELEAQLPGFRALREELTLEAGQHLQRDLALEIGSIQETVMVATGDVPPPPPPPPAPPRKMRRPQPSRDAHSALGSSPLSVGGAIKQPLKLKNVEPVYPAGLGDAGIQGKVELKAHIDTNGLVAGVEVLASPHSELANAAIEAVSQWQYTPTLLNGVPIETDMAVTVHFRSQP